MPFGTNRFATEMAQPILSVVAYGAEDRRAGRDNSRRTTLNGSAQSASLAAPTNTTERINSERSAAGSRKNLLSGLGAICNLDQSFAGEFTEESKDIRLAAFWLDVVLARNCVAEI